MPPLRPDRPAAAAVTRSAALLWLSTGAALQWSVVRFRVPIVFVLTVAALGLAWLLWRRRAPVLDPRSDRFVVPLTLLGAGMVAVAVPLFTYVPGGWRTAAVSVIVIASVVLAALSWAAGAASSAVGERSGLWWARAIALVAAGVQIALTTIAVLGDPAPRIDVWVMLQQSSDGLLQGLNFYEMTWSGSPGVQDMYTYLPWMTVLVAPGRWLAGDVRWALLVASLILLVGTWTLSRGRSGRGTFVGSSVIALIVVTPGTFTQIDQAWTEPMLAALLVWWAVLVTRGRPWWAVLPLALACASKQHMALLLPILLVWQAFGWRRLVAAALGAALLVAPWAVTAPQAFFADTVTSLVNFHPIRFANTWYLLFLNEFGVRLPFWITGLVVIGAVVGATVVVARRQPGIDEVLRWLALVLLVANLVNKQAFYNQFWLSLALVLVSFVVAPPGDHHLVPSSAHADRPTSELPSTQPGVDADSAPTRASQS